MVTQEVTLGSVHQAIKRFLPEGTTPDLYSWIQPTSFQSTSLTDIAYTYIVTGIANISPGPLGTNEFFYGSCSRRITQEPYLIRLPPTLARPRSYFRPAFMWLRPVVLAE
jgi:hypothetical protein